MQEILGYMGVMVVVSIVLAGGLTALSTLQEAAETRQTELVDAAKKAMSAATATP